MSELRPTSFTVDSSLEQPADQYTAELVGSADWAAATHEDRVTLLAGFYIDDVPSLVTVIKNGVIDDYRCKWTARSVRTSIKGRDQMALLLDRQYAIRYLRVPPAPTLSGAATVPERVGLYSAKQIAREILASIGMGLSWLCRDYSILESFNAVGRPIDLIKQLVEPWSLFEPLKIDVYLQNETVVCEPRTLVPVVPTLSAFAASGMRIRDLEIRKFKTPPIGRVHLTGAVMALMVPTPPGPEDDNPPVLDPDVDVPPSGVVVPPEDAGPPHEPPAEPPVVPPDVPPPVPPGPGDNIDPADPDIPPGPPVPPVVPPGGPELPPPTTTPSPPVLPPPSGTPTPVPPPLPPPGGPNPTDPGFGPQPPGGQTWPTGPGGLFAGGETTVSTESSAYDKAGRLVSRVNEASTYRTPDMIMLRQVKDSYGFKAGIGTKISTVIKESAWEPSVYGPNGVENQPLQKGQEDMMYAWRRSPGSSSQVFVLVQRDTTGYVYDGQRFMTLQATVTELRNAKTGQLREAKLVTKTYRSEGPLFIKVTTEHAIKNEKTNQWVVIARDETVGSGQRPGGVISGGKGQVVVGPGPGEDRPGAPGGGLPPTGGLPPSGIGPIHKLKVPEIRWDPPEDELAVGALLDPSLNATAVTPDAAATIIPGTFTYSPGPGTLVSAALITPSRGAWAPGQVYAGGDTVAPTVSQGYFYRASTGGTSGLTEPAWQTPPATGSTPATPDGTVVWAEESTTFTVLADFAPADTLTWSSAQAEHGFRTGFGLGLIEPEIRWDPPSSIEIFTPIDPALNATAVTPDPSHVPVPGTFAYSPPPGTLVDGSLLTPSAGQWAAATVYAAGTTVNSTDPDLSGLRWRVTVPGTTGATEPTWVAGDPTPIVDGTVTWVQELNTLKLSVIFTPTNVATYKTATATASVQIADIGEGGDKTPDVIWDPPSSLASGTLLDPYLNALAVTPDLAHTVVAGTWTYTPGPGTRAGVPLISGTTTWAATTVFAAGDLLKVGTDQFFTVTAGGTSGGTEPAWPAHAASPAPVTDGTVTWVEQSDTFTIKALFVPDDHEAWQSTSATRKIRTGTGMGLPEPEIRWTPPATLLPGALIDPALNATAVTPTPAHTPVAGTFTYAPPAGTHVGEQLLIATKGVWQASTIYASGDSVVPVEPGGARFRATLPGTSGLTEPAWPTGDAPVADGTVSWQAETTTIQLATVFQPTDPLAYKAVTATQSIRLQTTNSPGASGTPPDTHDLVPGGSEGHHELIVVIDPSPEAEPMQYDNPNLSLLDLVFIANQAALASGLWQWEAGFTGVNIPWVRRGSVFSIDGLHDENGADVSLPPWRMLSLSLSHEAASTTPSVTRGGRAIAWTGAAMDHGPYGLAATFVDRGLWQPSTTYNHGDTVLADTGSRRLVALRFSFAATSGNPGPYTIEPMTQNNQPGPCGTTTAGWGPPGTPPSAIAVPGIQWIHEFAPGFEQDRGRLSWFVVDAIVELEGGGQALHVTQGPLDGYWVYYAGIAQWAYSPGLPS